MIGFSSQLAGTLLKIVQVRVSVTWLRLITTTVGDIEELPLRPVKNGSHLAWNQTEEKTFFLPLKTPLRFNKP